MEVYLGIGTNLGERMENIHTCLHLIEERAGIIVAKSSVYETEPWGVENQDNYYNLVVRIDTGLTPDNLLETTQSIEKEMGRVKIERWGARIIDIDTLFYEDQIIKKPGLIIPHPRLLNRNFVLEPLIEIASDFIHPVKQKSLLSLKNENTDEAWIKKLN